MDKSGILIAAAAIVVLGLGWYFLAGPGAAPAVDTETATTTPVEVATTTEVVATTTPEVTTLPGEFGKSVNGNPLIAHTFGDGADAVLLVGGVHGGYEWNTVILAQQMVEYFTANPGEVPAGKKLIIVPVLNPDGLNAVVGTTTSVFDIAAVPEDFEATKPGRFNAHAVDLNRNFDCNWAPESTWQSRTVSAGTAAFSEPEAAAIRDLILAESPSAVVWWHSASDGVYSAICGEETFAFSDALMDTFATASGYPALGIFDAYPITGDAADWLGTLGIASVSVELSTHDVIEFEENLAGVKAVLAM